MLVYFKKRKLREIFDTLVAVWRFTLKIDGQMSAITIELH